MDYQESSINWDNSRHGHDLQGILPAPSSHDGLTAIDMPLGDPSALLSLSLGSGPSSVSQGQVPVHWPTSYSHLISSPNTAPAPEYMPYHVSRRTCDQDAWNPLLVTGVPSDPATTLSLQPIPVKYSTCPQSAPSESSSVLNAFKSSDSGYGTQSCATRSVRNSSHAVDSSCSPQLTSHHELESMEDVNSSSAQGREEESIKCDYPNCKWIGKCPSDKKLVHICILFPRAASTNLFRKHEARHRKVYKCDEPNCNRKEGFGTINDLSRHKKCVHKQEPVRGPKMMYMCFGRNCPRRNKQWPRSDNFKQHLARMHGGENATALLKR